MGCWPNIYHPMGDNVNVLRPDAIIIQFQLHINHDFSKEDLGERRIKADLMIAGAKTT